VVRQLAQDPSPNDSSFDVDHLLAALTTTSAAVCFFCHDPAHAASTCPLLLRMKSDPFARKVIIHLLSDLPSSSSQRHQPHSRRPLPRSSQTSRVHAITSDSDVDDFFPATLDTPAELPIVDELSPSIADDCLPTQDFYPAR